jgi:hypothetical protein
VVRAHKINQRSMPCLPVQIALVWWLWSHSGGQGDLAESSPNSGISAPNPTRWGALLDHQTLGSSGRKNVLRWRAAPALPALVGMHKHWEEFSPAGKAALGPACKKPFLV